MPFFKRFREKQEERVNHTREAKRQELFLRIQKVVIKELGIKDKEQIKPASRFREDLNVDSLDTIQLIMGLEDEFKIEIPDEEAEKILTVEDAINYFEKKV